MLKIAITGSNISVDEDFSSSMCYVGISVGQPYHDGDTFAQTIDKIDGMGFKECVFVVADTLQRYTIMIKNPGISEELARQQALADGAAWIERNSSYLDRLRTPKTVVRWDEWLSNPSYNQKREVVKKKYADDDFFKSTIGTVATKFITGLLAIEERKRKKGQSQELDRRLYDMGRAHPLCEEYVQEELGVIATWRDKHPGYDRILMAGDETALPTLSSISQTDIIMRKTEEGLSAYWRGPHGVTSKFFKTSEVSDIISELPVPGYSSEDAVLIDKIISKYGCARSFLIYPFSHSPANKDIRDCLKYLLKDLELLDIEIEAPRKNKKSKPATSQAQLTRDDGKRALGIPPDKVKTIRQIERAVFENLNALITLSALSLDKNAQLALFVDIERQMRDMQFRLTGEMTDSEVSESRLSPPQEEVISLVKAGVDQTVIDSMPAVASRADSATQMDEPWVGMALPKHAVLFSPIDGRTSPNNGVASSAPTSPERIVKAETARRHSDPGREVTPLSLFFDSTGNESGDVVRGDVRLTASGQLPL